jgi:hypothetical protein
LWLSGSDQIAEPLSPTGQSILIRVPPDGAFDDGTDFSAAIHDNPTLSQDIPVTLKDFRHPGAIGTDLVRSLGCRPLPAGRRHTIRRNEFHLAEVPSPIEVGHNEASEQHRAPAGGNLPIERAPVVSSKGSIRTVASLWLGLDTGGSEWSPDCDRQRNRDNDHGRPYAVTHVILTCSTKLPPC